MHRRCRRWRLFCLALLLCCRGRICGRLVLVLWAWCGFRVCISRKRLELWVGIFKEIFSNWIYMELKSCPSTTIFQLPKLHLVWAEFWSSWHRVCSRVHGWVDSAWCRSDKVKEWRIDGFLVKIRERKNIRFYGIKSHHDRSVLWSRRKWARPKINYWNNIE